MTLINVYWAWPVNILEVYCDCGQRLLRPSNYSLVECSWCGRRELWHSVEPKPEQGPWSEPVMANHVLTGPDDEL